MKKNIIFLVVTIIFGIINLFMVYGNTIIAKKIFEEYRKHEDYVNNRYVKVIEGYIGDINQTINKNPKLKKRGKEAIKKAEKVLKGNQEIVTLSRKTLNMDQYTIPALTEIFILLLCFILFFYSGRFSVRCSKENKDENN